MIVRETFLKELFSQIPDVIDSRNMSFPVKFHWGGQDDLNLYMKNEKGNTTPLIWLVQDKARQKSLEQSSRVKLILAKSSTHKTSMNPLVWETEFVDYLNPLLEKVIKCLQQSGRTIIMNQEYDVYREANYSEFERDGKTKTIDHWNVIIFEADLILTESPDCFQTINFN